MPLINYELLLCFVLALPIQKVKVVFWVLLFSSKGKRFISCCCHMSPKRQERVQSHQLSLHNLDLPLGVAWAEIIPNAPFIKSSDMLLFYLLQQL